MALCEVACKAREGEGSPGARRAKFKELAEAVRAISAVSTAHSTLNILKPAALFCSISIDQGHLWPDVHPEGSRGEASLRCAGQLACNTPFLWTFSWRVGNRLSGDEQGMIISEGATLR